MTSLRARLGGGLFSGLGALGLYIATLSPGVGWYDSAEFTAAAITWGIPHAPGYPLYTLLGWLACQLPLDPSLAVNSLSALFSALAVGLCWSFTRSLGASPTGATLAAASLAVCPLLWNNATIAEVYGPGLAAALGVFVLLERARATRRPLLALCAAGLAGLGLGLHYFVATCGLGYAVYLFAQPSGRPPASSGDDGARSPSFASAAKLGGLALLWVSAGGAANLALLKVRAAADPAVNILRDVSMPDPVLWLVLGGGYRDWWAAEASVPLSTKAMLLGQEFFIQLQLGLLLALLGLGVLVRRDRVRGSALILAVLGNIVFFINYEVHDLENFFLPAVALLCVGMGIGLTALSGWAATRWPARPALPRLAVLTLLLPLLQLTAWQELDRSDDHAAEEYAEAVDHHLPQDATLVRLTLPFEWQRDAVFTLWYQQALGHRPDVQVLTRPMPDEAQKRAVPDEIRMHLAHGRRVFVLHEDVARELQIKWQQVGPIYELLP